MEVFTNTGKAGGCPSQSEATARLVSMALRSGLDSKILIEQLKGIRCPSTIRQPNIKVTSCPDAIAKVLQKVIESINCKEKSNDVSKEVFLSVCSKNVSKQIKFCPECGKEVEHEGGCVVCRECGFSKCG